MLRPGFEGDDRSGRIPWLSLALAALWLGVSALEATGHTERAGRFALAPGAFALPGAFSFFALHTGGVHLGVSLAWLALAGPALEDRFGRVCFGALLALAIGVGAALTLGLDPTGSRSLVGASAGLAALLGAATVRFGRRGLPLRIGLGTRASFRLALPGVVFPLAWLLGVIALRLSDLDPALTSGPDLRAHLALGAGGVVVAGLVRAIGLEERWLRGRERSRRERAVTRWLERAGADVAHGRPDAAYLQLEEALAGAPDPRILEALLAAAGECGRLGDALAAGARVVAERWHAGRREVAAALWTRLVRAEPDLALDMRLRLALAPVLAASGLTRESALTLRGELRGKRRDVTPGAALRIAEAARSVHPPTAVEAARRALESNELDAAKRARIEAWIDALETDPRALIALELDPKPEEAAAPVPRKTGPDVARRAEPLDPDPQALALPEASAGVELDAPRAGGDLDGEVEDPRALVLDPEDR